MPVLKWSRLQEEVEVSPIELGDGKRLQSPLIKRLVLGLGLVGLLLYLGLTRLQEGSWHRGLDRGLNLTDSRAQGLRAEVQEVGRRVNSARGEVAGLQQGLERARVAKPWLEGLDRLGDRVREGLVLAQQERQGLGANVSKVASKEEVLTGQLEKAEQGLEKAQRGLKEQTQGLQVLSNSTQGVAALVHSRSLNHASYLLLPIPALS